MLGILESLYRFGDIRDLYLKYGDINKMTIVPINKIRLNLIWNLIELKSSLIQIEISLIQLEISLIQLESSLIQLESSLYMYN